MWGRKLTVRKLDALRRQAAREAREKAATRKAKAKLYRDARRAGMRPACEPLPTRLEDRTSLGLRSTFPLVIEACKYYLTPQL